MKRVFSGMRPTGKLHLGHMAGALTNWLKLQQDSEYECFFGVMDWHAMTSNYADLSDLQDNCHSAVVEWLAVGLDPVKSPIFCQSHVPGHVELGTALGMITPLGWLYRCPTYKDQIANMQNKDLGNYGFLGYPVLMASDILLYKSTAVPVGEDQSAHLEICRELARRFNSFYGATFPEPQTLLTKTPKVPGTDGRKMSKSYGNSLLISDREDDLWNKLRGMTTDPARVRKTDPGEPTKCPVWDLHQVFNTSEEQKAELAEGCRTAGIGCVACKKALMEHLKELMTPIWERYDALEAQPDLVKDVLADGARRARVVADQTMEEVRRAMGFVPLF